MGLRDDVNKALHFTNEETDYIMSSILANFLLSYLGDLIGGKKRKEKEMEDKIPDRWEVQDLLRLVLF